MNSKEDIINLDEEGWPVYKQNVRDILAGLYFVKEGEINGKKVYYINQDRPELDIYPIVMHDDGSGYCSKPVEFVSVVSYSPPDMIEVWVDVKSDNLCI